MATFLLLIFSPMATNAARSPSTLAVALMLLSALGTLLLIVIACLSLHNKSSATVCGALALAAMPFCLSAAFRLLRVDPGAYGIATVGFYFNGLLSELAAVVLLLTVAIRALWRRATQTT